MNSICMGVYDYYDEKKCAYNLKKDSCSYENMN